MARGRTKRGWMGARCACRAVRDVVVKEVHHLTCLTLTLLHWYVSLRTCILLPSPKLHTLACSRRRRLSVVACILPRASAAIGHANLSLHAQRSCCVTLSE
eukprot:5805597-Pleurochrysis_carterae.AAC.3